MKGALVSLADVRDPVHCCCLGVVLSRITRSLSEIIDIWKIKIINLVFWSIKIATPLHQMSYFGFRQSTFFLSGFSF